MGDNKEMKEIFAFKNLNAKSVNKATIASIGSNAVESLLAVLEACKEMKEEVEKDEESELTKSLKKSLNAVLSVESVISETSNVKTIKSFIENAKGIKDEELEIENELESTHNEGDDTENAPTTSKTSKIGTSKVAQRLNQLANKVDETCYDEDIQIKSNYNFVDINPNNVLNKKNAPYFYGKEGETIFTWLHFVKTILSSNGIDKERWVTLVLTQLKDGALDTAVNYSLNSDVKDWDTFEKLMLRTYEPIDFQKELRRKLKYLVQGKKPVLEFNTEFLKLCNKIRDLKQEERLEYYLESLSGEYQYAIENALGVENIDLDKAMQIATKYENIFLKKTKEQLKLQINTIRPTYKKKFEENKGNKGEIVCYFCKKVGHKSNVCRSKLSGGKVFKEKGTTENKEIVCFKCKKTGHKSNACTQRRCNVIRMLNNITAEASTTKLLKIGVKVTTDQGVIEGRALIDPGSMCSAISREMALKYNFKINESETTLKALNVAQDVIGVTDEVDVNVRDHVCKMKLYIIENDYDFILGLNWMEAVDAGVISKQGRRILQFSAESIYLDEDSGDEYGEEYDENSEGPYINTTSIEEESDLFDLEWTFEDSKLDLGLSVESSYKVRKDKLLDRFRKLGATCLKDLGRCAKTKHKIRLSCDVPIFKRPYRVSHAERDIIRSQVNDLLDAGIVRRSKSPWSSPVILVKKKNGSHRLCINYIPLNQVTITEKWPLPRIDEICERISNSFIFDTYDLKDGYYQVEMEEKSIEMTAFSTSEGHYEFVRMPFGLKNAATDFARNMHIILGDLPFVETYLDDTIVHSKNVEEHLDHQKQVLERLENSGLKLNLKKCSFWKREIKILGHVVKNGSIKMDPEKIQAISQRVPPNTVKQLQSFLGCTNFYRKFIKDYAKTVKPLAELLKKDTKYIWDSTRDEAFNKLKKSLVSYPILRAPDFNKNFFLKTDASHYALGIILGQLDVDNNEIVIAYASRLLKGAELNYSTSRKEVLAVIYGIKYFRVYLHGTSFDCLTDHKAIKWLMHNKDLTGTFSRMATLIQEFDINFIHRAGSKHGDADALSRPVMINNIVAEDEDIVPALLRDDDPYENAPLVHFLKFGRHINGSTRRQVTRTSKLVNNFRFHDGNIEFYKKSKNGCKYLIYPRKEDRGPLVEDYHSVGHFMAHTTYERLSEKYFWKNMKNDIINMINKCIICIRNNRSKIWNHPATALEINSIHERVHIDLHFGLNPTKEGFIGNLVIIESLSDWPWVRSIKSKSMQEIAEHFLEYIAEYGPPKEILSDLGNEQQFACRATKKNEHPTPNHFRITLS